MDPQQTGAAPKQQLPTLPSSQLALEPVVPIPVPKAAENAKLKPKIMQLFLEDKVTQKMKPIVLRSNDRVWQIMDAVGADRIKYKTRLFCGEVELTEEPGKTLLDAGVPDNSTVHYLLEPLFINQRAAPPPPEEEGIPCEICHGAFPVAEFQTHAPCFADAPPPRRAAPPAAPAANPVPVEEAIPCERCGKPVAFAQYMDHANTCGFT